MLKSNWQPLKSSQKSILLNIFSNDLDNGMEFVGGTKRTGQLLQQEVGTLRNLSELEKSHETF